MSRKNNLLFSILCLLALLLLIGAYSNSFDSSFHFDDAHVVVNNIYLRSLDNVPQFFTDAHTHTSLPANAVYRPLVALSLAVDYALGGDLDPRQFHITQFALHVILGGMIFFLFLDLMNRAVKNRWNPYLALVATTFFCLHTTNTETLNTISARSEVISTLGVLGSLLLYIRLPRWRKFGLYLIPMAVGTLAKPPAVVFAPILFVYVFLFESDESLLRKKFWAATLTSLPAFIVGLLVYLFVDSMNAPEVVYGGGTRWEYLRTQPFVWVHYLRLFFLPVGLTADTDWKLLPTWIDTHFFVGVFVIGLLLWVLWRSSQRHEMKPVSFGLSWFVLALLPASSIFPLAEVANEHRIFFPYIGLTLAVFWWAAECVKKWRIDPRIAWVAVLLLLFAHAGGTYERNKVWKSEETLWADVVQKSPTNGRALMNYGLALMARGQLQRAKDLYERALIYTPNYAHLETNLGIVLAALGDGVQAEAHFKRALQLNPNFDGGHQFYGAWLERQGRTDEAVFHLTRAIAISPGNIAARQLLMKIYAGRGERDKLRDLVQKTLAIWPEDPVAKSYAKTFGR